MAMQMLEFLFAALIVTGGLICLVDYFVGVAGGGGWWQRRCD
jgi:hypothetical protein